MVQYTFKFPLESLVCLKTDLAALKEVPLKTKTNNRLTYTPFFVQEQLTTTCPAGTQIFYTLAASSGVTFKMIEGNLVEALSALKDAYAQEPKET